jgi:hypothetical protein
MKHNPVPDDWTSNPTITDVEREAIVRKWTNSVYKLYDRTTGRARKSLNWDLYYLETYSGLGIPLVSKGGGWGLRYWLDRKEDGFVIVPLIESDAKLHRFFAAMLTQPTYQESPRAIYLPPDRISTTWRAIILHHELGHTMFHRLKIHRTGHELDRWSEEYEVFVNEFRLIRSIYGKPYGNLITKLSKGYESAFRQGKLHVDVSNNVAHKRLRHIFGKPQSKFEHQLQQCVVTLNALYRALDRIHTDGDKTEHYSITRWFYGARYKKTETISD